MHGDLAFELTAFLFAPSDDEPSRRCERARQENHAHDAHAHDAHALERTSPAAIGEDDALFHALRAGDVAAFDTFVVAHLDALVGFAASLVDSIEAGEDIVQDVLTTLWQKRGALPQTGSPRAYVFAAVRHRALDARKHDRVQLRTRDRLAIELAGSVTPPPMPLASDSDLTQQGRVASVRAALATLPERQRTALFLRYVRSLKVAEIGTVLGVSTKAAEQLLIRAIRTLRTAAA